MHEMTKDVLGEFRMRSLVAPICLPINGYVKRILSFAKFVRVIAYVHCFDTMFIVLERRKEDF